MATTGHDLIVVGASAGGVETLRQVLRELPPNLPAAVLIVLHISHQPWDLLPNILSRITALPCKPALEGEAIQKGTIYTAVPDHHLVVSQGHLHVTHGPKENYVRPAIDPLFRSAAHAYGPRVVGVILSGTLDDGTAGLEAIKERGGIAVCQDPGDALFPQMPQSAIANVSIDHIEPSAQMGALLGQLASLPAPDEKLFPVTRKLELETKIARGDGSSMETMDALGNPSRVTCPECGGALWELQEGKLLRFRCHTGHAFTVESLQSTQSGEVEKALWAAARAMQESIQISQRVAGRARQHNNPQVAQNFEEKARAYERDLATLRSILVKE